MPSNQGRAPRKWAIRARRLFDGSQNPPIENALVVIEDGTISAVGPETDVALSEDTSVTDVGDRTLLPGLIDAHVHMLSTGGVSSRRDSRAMTDEQAMLMGASNAILAVQSGITDVRDCGDRKFLSLTLRDSIAGRVVAGPHMMCSGPVITSTAGQLW